MDVEKKGWMVSTGLIYFKILHRGNFTSFTSLYVLPKCTKKFYFCF
jgi:hypothetical protein